MPKAYPNQTSFAQGELSPLMSGQVGSDPYETGTSIMRNMIADPRGPAINRDAMEHIMELIAGQEARLETYNRTDTDLFTFIIVDQKLLFVRNVNFPVIIEFNNAPWLEDEVKDIYIVPLPDGRSFYLLHPDHPPYKLTDNSGALIQVPITVSGDFTVPTDITEIFYCLTGAGGGGGGGYSQGVGGGGVNRAGGSGGGGSGVLKGTATVTPGQVLPVVIGGGGTGGINGGDGIVTEGLAGGISTFNGDSVPGGNGGGVKASPGGAGVAGGGNGGKGFIIFTGNPNRAAIAGSPCNSTCDGAQNPGGTISGQSGGGGGGGGESNGGNGIEASPTPVVLPGGGGGAGGASFTSGANGGSGKIIISYEQLAAAVTLEQVTFTNPPPEWGLGNWPACGAYFQSRLWLANIRFRNETFWASGIGDPEDFEILASDDSKGLSLTMENFGAIRWMVGAKVLLLGTSNGEYFMTSATGVLIPSDIRAVQQSSYGSANIQPVRIGDQVIYVSPDRRKIRAMNYEERKTNWMSTDLTLPSEHITKGLIKKLAWSQHPHNLLWVVLSNGTMCALSYERGNEIKGWHRHDTDGRIISASAGFNGKRSVLILGTERLPGQINLERMSDGHYFDAWEETTQFTQTVPGYTWIDGYDHLDGRDVQIIVTDDVNEHHYHTSTVSLESDTNVGDGVVGRIYFPSVPTAVLASVGLGFTAEVAPMGLGQQLMPAFKKRRNKVYVKIVDSGVPLLNGKREGGQEMTITSSLHVATRIVEETIIGWDRDAIVTISQDLPVPLTVTAILGEAQQNAL